MAINDNSFREEIKNLIREVLTEMLIETSSTKSFSRGITGTRKGQVTNPTQDKRLKKNRGKI